MAAAIGNKYAVGNNGGRPPLYNSPEELTKAMCLIIANQPLITRIELTKQLGFKTKQSFYDLKKIEGFKDAIEAVLNTKRANPKKPRVLGIKWENNNQYQKEKYQKDPLTKITTCIASSIRYRLKKKPIGTIRHLHYTIEELKQHLERQFKKGMSWDNYGKEWHIDHVIPVSWFHIESVNDYSFRQCWDLTNLKPEWKNYNIVKGNRFTENNQLKIAY